MISEAIDFRYLLLENYKKMKFSETEVVVILMVDHLLSQGNPFITADLLSLKMSLDIKQIDECLASLLEKNVIEYITRGKKTITTLDPIKKRLYKEFRLTIADETIQEASSKYSQEENDNVFLRFEKTFGRTLSPVEVSKIREWISFGYSDEQIIEALKESLSKGNKTLRAVDKVLLNWAKRDDIESEGRSFIDKTWDKNMQETIRIAKTPWLDNDDDDE